MSTNLMTENRNIKTMSIDDMSSLEFLAIMNEEDAKVTSVIKEELPNINRVVTLVVDSFKSGGRLIYIGAGTSGRLGVLDAVECVPTFGTDESKVQGILAGGYKAMFRAVEGAEDSEELGKEDLTAVNITDKDVIIGIAASGRTPYVNGGLKYAKDIGAKTASISCNKNSLISKISDVSIEVAVGPEVLTGSTRLKAGTAQKIVLNMISTAAMVSIGKTYGNLMVDVQMTNNKLIERGKRIVMQATEVSYDVATEVLNQSDNSPKVAIVMIERNCTTEEAIERLKNTNGFVKKAIEK